MAGASKGYGERAVTLVGAVVLLVLGWLTSRYMTGMEALAWIFWVGGVAYAAFALFAPIGWVRTALGWSLLTQDMFKR